MEQPQRRPPRGLLARLAEPVDGASVAAFRIAFGLIMCGEVVRYFAHGWIARYYIEPGFHFTYLGFGWVRPWPGIGMYVHFAALGVAALFVALGLWYRASAIALWVLFTYVFLLEEARYLNHFYAASLFALLLAVVPAHNAFSIDAWCRRPRTPPTVPVWALWVLRAQVAVIYFFGGIAKINHDWVRGEPMRSWLVAKSDVPIIDLIVRNRLELLLFSYGGLLFDLLIVPALLWKRTRPFAFVAAVVFHVVNSQLFSIGIFPWMMIAASTLFFAPRWPRRWRGGGAERRRTSSAANLRPSASPPLHPSAPQPLNPALFTSLAIYLTLQVTIPLRHFLYPGNVSWTEEGHLFSWHMKLRDKEGSVRFVITDRATGQTSIVQPETQLMPWQTAKMSTRPDMILQFAHHLASERGGSEGGIQVRVQSLVSLNGGGVRPMIDPRADLAAERRTFWPAWWILPGEDDTEILQGGRNPIVGNR